jgi:sterol desaturase/sphingolipid hydroxylase (fatty acid hydroxylase superfamily)
MEDVRGHLVLKAFGPSTTRAWVGGDSPRALEDAMQLGRFGYYADFFGGFASSLVLFALAMSHRTWVSRAEWLASLMIGIVLWTLLEYGVHRWLYHGVEFLIRLHDAHHQNPTAYIGAPPFVGIALIFIAVYMPGLLLSSTVASGLTAGVLIGYLAYQLVHHATHFWQPTRGSYLYRARLRHSRHHHHRELGNLGITTALWDHVFDTAIDVRRSSAATVPGAADRLS